MYVVVLYGGVTDTLMYPSVIYGSTKAICLPCYNITYEVCCVFKGK